MNLPLVVALLLTGLGVARGQDLPGWAYPPLPAREPSQDPTPLSVPGSNRLYTQGQIDRGYGVADWFPDEHPPMPDIVANGGPPPVRACAMCHLPNGQGHPESAELVGLPAAYLIGQTRAFVSGARSGPRAASMVPIASGLSDKDLQEAAQYFAQLRPIVWTRIVESDTAPVTRLGLGAVRYRAEEGGTEKLGQRIISVPEDDTRTERRDDHSGFVEFVPLGSVARGRELVQRSEAGVACASCHGERLSGHDDTPPLSGRLALVTFRALTDIQFGHRTTPGALTMRAAMPRLQQGEMIAIAAYLASLPPE